jgi:hypothetical protein
MTWRFDLKGILFLLLAGVGAVVVTWWLQGSATSLQPGEAGPTSVLRVETAIHKDLVENSVAVTSVSQPGIIFGLNDSGNQPRIFAFDSSGRGRGVWTVVGASNRDWEAASLGPCRQRETWCVYIGDVGDNEARRPYVTIYRVAEPSVSDSARAAIPLPVEASLNVSYSDQPHDVEAMYVGVDGSMFFITKRRLLDGQGRPRRALIFKVPGSSWDSSGTVVARLVDSLPIVPGERQGGQISDAALSPDGKLLAVRTYADVFLFEIDSVTQLPRPGQTPLPCTIRALKETQGEGIAWWWDRLRLVLTSERRNAPFHVVSCPLPSL